MMLQYCLTTQTRAVIILAILKMPHRRHFILPDMFPEFDIALQTSSYKCLNHSSTARAISSPNTRRTYIPKHREGEKKTQSLLSMWQGSTSVNSQVTFTSFLIHLLTLLFNTSEIKEWENHVKEDLCWSLTYLPNFPSKGSLLAHNITHTEINERTIILDLKTRWSCDCVQTRLTLDCVQVAPRTRG